MCCQDDLHLSQLFQWARGDSNSQLLRDTLLRRTRIPIPPRALFVDYLVQVKLFLLLVSVKVFPVESKQKYLSGAANLP